jgi:hypothetical protein
MEEDSWMAGAFAICGWQGSSDKIGGSSSAGFLHVLF